MPVGQGIKVRATDAVHPGCDDRKPREVRVGFGASGFSVGA